MELLTEDTGDSSWSRPDDKDLGEDGESRTNLGAFDSLGLISGEENLVMKPSSISNAWRQGTTPVQKKQQMVSIEKLLATNKLHSVLRGITPAKSPVLPSQKFTELKPLDRREQAEELTELEELSRGSKKTLGDSKTSVLSMELIRVRAFYLFMFF